jgi:hypothetical protein
MFNWKILSHPMNWLTIWLMVLIAGIFGHLLLSLFEQEPATVASTTLPTGLSAQQYPDVPLEAVYDAQIASAQSSYDAMMNYGGTPMMIF